MSISLSEMIQGIDPQKTVLFFGAGSSIPSGAPSVSKIIDIVGTKFNIETDGFSLSEISSIAEEKRSRKELIQSVRSLFKTIHVTGALLNLPLYNWKNIYTTNYDQLIEQAYSKKDKPLSIISSNYDFQEQKIPEATKLFKIHGTINKDISDGYQNRIIISEADYDNTTEYRDALWDALKNDLNGANLVIIGYSLSDQHIKNIVNRAIEINGKSHTPFTINLVLYSKDENRAMLFERRGINVAFGDIDTFFLELQKKNEPAPLNYTATGDPLDSRSVLQNITINVRDSLRNFEKDVSAMFHGWPATYSDIKANLTFDRTLERDIETSLKKEAILLTTILGASGTGKSTLARKVLMRLNDQGFFCWEHKCDHKLLVEEWRAVAKAMQNDCKAGVLFIDDAHTHLYEINNLIDLLSADESVFLKILVTSSRNQWSPRIKTPNIFKKGNEFVLKKLDEIEVENLLTLIDTNNDLQPLVENSFSGFSRNERKRRLTAKCESDTFVCLKNIFASEKFDDIVLREFAELDDNSREVYRLVSAMESAGVNVHRQLIVRLLGIPAQNISPTLANLMDIIHEYTVSDREGIFGWKGRHPVITDIVTKYKMTDESEYLRLFETVIDNIIPTYDIEIRTIKQMCSFESGISRFPDKNIRNKLLRKMISKVPGERLPRHRLIRYLIDVNQLEKAETEIRLFENDFKADGPTERFKVILLLKRSEDTPGILDEDRIAILDMARSTCLKALDKYENNKNLMNTYFDVGLEYYKRTGDPSICDEAIEILKDAEERIGDPEITSSLIQNERKLAKTQLAVADHIS